MFNLSYYMARLALICRSFKKSPTLKEFDDMTVAYNMGGEL